MFEFLRMKGVTKASDDELKGIVERCGIWSTAGEVILMGGILFEIALWIFPAANMAEASRDQGIANALVFLGILLEFGANKRGSAAQSEQTRRLVEENTALRKAASQRVVTKAQFDTLQSLRGKIDELNVIHDPDHECMMFGYFLSNALIGAGIKSTQYGTDREITANLGGLLLYAPQGEESAKLVLDTLKACELSLGSWVSSLMWNSPAPPNVMALIVMKLGPLPPMEPLYMGPPTEPA